MSPPSASPRRRAVPELRSVCVASTSIAPELLSVFAVLVGLIVGVDLSPPASGEPFDRSESIFVSDNELLEVPERGSPAAGLARLHALLTLCTSLMLLTLLALLTLLGVSTSLMLLWREVPWLRGRSSTESCPPSDDESSSADSSVTSPRSRRSHSSS